MARPVVALIVRAAGPGCLKFALLPDQAGNYSQRAGNSGGEGATLASGSNFRGPAIRPYWSNWGTENNHSPISDWSGQGCSAREKMDL